MGRVSHRLPAPRTNRSRHLTWKLSLNCSAQLICDQLKRQRQGLFPEALGGGGRNRAKWTKEKKTISGIVLETEVDGGDGGVSEALKVSRVRKGKANRTDTEHFLRNSPDEKAASRYPVRNNYIYIKKVACSLRGSLLLATATQTYRSSISNRKCLVCLSTFGSVAESKCQWESGGWKKNVQLFTSNFPLQHQRRVGSDWLERRLHVIPWTGRGAHNGEVHEVTCAWGSPTCLPSCAGRVRAGACVGSDS